MSVLDIDKQDRLIADELKKAYGNIYKVLGSTGLIFLESGFYGEYVLKFQNYRGYYEYPVRVYVHSENGKEWRMSYDLNGVHKCIDVTTLEEIILIKEAVRCEYEDKGYILQKW